MNEHTVDDPSVQNSSHQIVAAGDRDSGFELACLVGTRSAPAASSWNKIALNGPWSSPPEHAAMSDAVDSDASVEPDSLQTSPSRVPTHCSQCISPQNWHVVKLNQQELLDEDLLFQSL